MLERTIELEPEVLDYLNNVLEGHVSENTHISLQLPFEDGCVAQLMVVVASPPQLVGILYDLQGHELLMGPRDRTVFEGTYHWGSGPDEHILNIDRK